MHFQILPMKSTQEKFVVFLSKLQLTSLYARVVDIQQQFNWLYSVFLKGSFVCNIQVFSVCCGIDLYRVLETIFEVSFHFFPDRNSLLNCFLLDNNITIQRGGHGHTKAVSIISKAHNNIIKFKPQILSSFISFQLFFVFLFHKYRMINCHKYLIGRQCMKQLM